MLKASPCVTLFHRLFGIPNCKFCREIIAINDSQWVTVTPPDSFFHWEEIGSCVRDCSSSTRLRSYSTKTVSDVDYGLWDRLLLLVSRSVPNKMSNVEFQRLFWFNLNHNLSDVKYIIITCKELTMRHIFMMRNFSKKMRSDSSKYSIFFLNCFFTLNKS